MTENRKTRISAAVAAYNEEGGIRQLIDSLAGQHIHEGERSEIVVVASGCTDHTEDEVRAAAAHDPRVKLIVQNARLGKVSAVNAYLRERDPEAEVLVLSSADLILQPGCIDVLVSALRRDSALGICGGRAVPENPRDTVMGEVVGFLWDLHHERALEQPKIGEVVAVRAALVEPLPEASAVDEASLESVVAKKGYKLGYFPEAVVVNRGPTSVREYFEQRRRIAAGHYWLRDTCGYEVSTLDWRRCASLALRKISFSRLSIDGPRILAVGIEALARSAGYLDFRRHYSHAIWKMARSARASARPSVPRS